MICAIHPQNKLESILADNLIILTHTPVPVDEDEAIVALTRLLGDAVGDDCYTFTVGDRTWALSTDMLFQGTDLPLRSSPEDWGWKAMAATISDLVSAGTVPRFLLLAIGVPKDSSDLVGPIATGAKACCDTHDCHYVGGDLSVTDRVTLVSSGLGEGDRVPGRGGAVPGHLLCVTGEMGTARLGLLCLQAGLDDAEDVVKAFLRPRIQAGSASPVGELASASMDISDGLARSVRQLAERSDVGVEVVLADVPCSSRTKELCERLGVSFEEIVIGGGEEFETLLTLSPDRLQEARTSIPTLTVIGRVAERADGLTLVRGERRERLPSVGWRTYEVST